MWTYQQYFTHNVQRYAKELFGEISSALKPQVFLIGVPRKEGYPAFIEPEWYDVVPDSFEGVRDIAKGMYERDPRKNKVFMDTFRNERWNEEIKAECLNKAVKQLVEEYSEGKISFVSPQVILGDYEIFVVLQFEECEYNRFYALRRSPVGMYELRTGRVRRSLIDALVYTYLGKVTDQLYKPQPGVYMQEIRADKKEILRLAASNFIGTAISGASKSKGRSDLFDIANYISSLKYEGDSSMGKLIICREDHPNIDLILRLGSAVQLKEYRKVRKLLEMTSSDLHLYSDGDYILGLAKLKGVYDGEREDLFVINFSESYKWELIHNAQVMMVVDHTIPGLLRSKIDKAKFEEIVRRVIRENEEQNIEKLWTMINTATGQKKGSLIIISNEAESEAKRLEYQSTSIKPVQLNEDLIKNITAIDGAVLLDTQGYCHSIGVILDGVATSKGTSGRGARFNSAIRYVEMRKRNCVAVIISEDGMVDLYPQVEPKVKRSELVLYLEQLKQEIGLDRVNYDRYRSLMNYFVDHKFYLSREMCDEINRLKDECEEKLDREEGVVYLQYPALYPNPNMDESYFVDEMEQKAWGQEKKEEDTESKEIKEIINE